MKRNYYIPPVLGVVVLLIGLSAAPAGAVPRSAIESSGSSWAAVAVNGWNADVAPSGVKVSYTTTGSAAGRQNFAASVTDFAVSDIGYQGQNKKTGAFDKSARRYVYAPIVAGGTSFPYKILVGGKPLTGIRLSGETIAKIFTGGITNWNDGQIKKDNNDRILPSKKIIPVVHSEGAGSTAQFTSYLADQYSAIWKTYAGSTDFTEYFPVKKGQRAQNGSDGVMNYILSKAGDGAIGYDEYAYPLAAGIPVAKVLNKAGYYTLPTQYNDAVALTAADINYDKSSPDYLLQKLHKVYVNPRQQTYPLSSYSYAIIPVGNEASSPKETRMDTPKRQTLADYLFYAVCDGQRAIGNIGYSSLPLNLVKASFQQIAKLREADAKVDVSSQVPAKCNNPTFDPSNPTKNKLAEIAPAIPACDKQGAGPCGFETAVHGTGGGGTGGGGTGTGGGTGSGSGSGSATGGGTGTGTGGGTGGGTGTGSGGTGGTGGAGGDGDTGTLGGDSFTANDGEVSPQAIDLAAYRRAENGTLFSALAAGLLLSILVLPPLVARRMRSGLSAGSVTLP